MTVDRWRTNAGLLRGKEWQLSLDRHLMTAGLLPAQLRPLA